MVRTTNSIFLNTYNTDVYFLSNVWSNKECSGVEFIDGAVRLLEIFVFVENLRIQSRTHHVFIGYVVAVLLDEFLLQFVEIAQRHGCPRSALDDRSAFQNLKY